MRRKNILFMGAPGVGVGTCMRMVAPILLVFYFSNYHHKIPSFRSKYVIQKEMQQGTDFGKLAEVFDTTSFLYIEIRI